MALLTSVELEDLQSFVKDWLRHQGRTQADLRRALRAESIRMPVLLEALQHIHDERGLVGLAERLCGIEQHWHEDQPAPECGEASDGLGQLDLLLEAIRRDGEL